MTITQDENEPRNVTKALLGLDKENWTKVMEEEMESIKSNQVWKVVDISKGHKAIRNKWILKIKCKTNNTIEKYKVKLVAKGYIQ